MSISVYPSRLLKAMLEVVEAQDRKLCEEK